MKENNSNFWSGIFGAIIATTVTGGITYCTQQNLLNQQHLHEDRKFIFSTYSNLKKDISSYRLKLFQNPSTRTRDEFVNILGNLNKNINELFLLIRLYTKNELETKKIDFQLKNFLKIINESEDYTGRPKEEGDYFTKQSSAINQIDDEIKKILEGSLEFINKKFSAET